MLLKSNQFSPSPTHKPFLLYSNTLLFLEQSNFSSRPTISHHLEYYLKSLHSHHDHELRLPCRSEFVLINKQNDKFGSREVCVSWNFNMNKIYEMNTNDPMRIRQNADGVNVKLSSQTKGGKRRSPQPMREKKEKIMNYIT
ncbi:CLUMA_CG008850, isoform A [Clunio marinus]|uniref:CLUMA_CG008850, isoform A n=1 Tax=Clunio marinus TaxID=568069 RepID=A0A1J1I4E4_9DIPT|nr:CLUMA_CG008850, isoform A [Clunio marinus]